MKPKPLSLDEFVKLFPDRGVCLATAIDSGTGTRGWAAGWCRLVSVSDRTGIPLMDPLETGASPEEALGKLAYQEYLNAQKKVEMIEKELHIERETLLQIAKRLGGEL